MFQLPPLRVVHQVPGPTKQDVTVLLSGNNDKPSSDDATPSQGEQRTRWHPKCCRDPFNAFVEHYFRCLPFKVLIEHEATSAIAPELSQLVGKGVLGSISRRLDVPSLLEADAWIEEHDVTVRDFLGRPLNPFFSSN